MAWELKIDGNYFYATQNVAPFTVHEFAACNVRIAKKYTDSTEFNFQENRKNIEGMKSVDIADIIAENGTDFTDLASFESWKNENTGCSEDAGEAAPNYTDLLTSIDDNTTPITHVDTAGSVLPANGLQTIGAGAYAYTLALVLQTGVDPVVINYTTDIGTYNGVNVPIGYAMGIDGDDNGGTLSNGVTVQSFGNAMWVWTIKN